MIIIYTTCFNIQNILVWLMCVWVYCYFKCVSKIVKKQILASTSPFVCPSVSVRLSISLSVRKSAPTGRIFMKFDISVIFDKSVEKIQILLKPDRNNGHFTWRTLFIFDHISLSSCWNEECLRQHCRENQNTHFIFKNFFFRKPCRLWAKVGKYCTAGQATDDNIIWRMLDN
jgi:hypothetical protein